MKISDWFGSFPEWEEIPSAKDPWIIDLPIIRRVKPTRIVHDLIGVSPMTGPCENIATLRARYAESLKDQDEQDN